MWTLEKKLTCDFQNVASVRNVFDNYFVVIILLKSENEYHGIKDNLS